MRRIFRWPFRRKAAPVPPPLPPRPRAPRPEPALPKDFAALASLLRLPEAPAGNVSEADEREDQLLADAIFDHYLAHKPAPESFPGLSLQVLNLVAAPDIDARKLSQLVSRDPALCANLLRVANSALYRGVSAIGTVRDALARLGLVEVARVASVVAARSLFHPRMRAQFAALEPHFRAAFQHSVSCALASSALALRTPPADSTRAYLGGLLHDVGKTVALRSIAALGEGRGGAPGFAGAERIARVLERVHVEIGEDVHRAWSLPDYLVRIATHHHDARVLPDDVTDLHVVRVVSSLRQLRSAPGLNPRAGVELWESATVLGVDAFALRLVDTELRGTDLQAAQLATA